MIDLNHMHPVSLLPVLVFLPLAVGCSPENLSLKPKFVLSLIEFSVYRRLAQDWQWPLS